MQIFERIYRKLKFILLGNKLNNFTEFDSFFNNKVGIEIGGPSDIFKDNNILPIYSIAKRVDGVNFSDNTVWEKKIDVGKTYNYNNTHIGFQYIAEASDLTVIEDNKYDFLLSSHSLEHCANVLKTIIEWKRVVKDNGILVVVVPDKRYTFDHRRSITKFNHILDDYYNNIDEKDLSHLEEILRLHDISKDYGVKSLGVFKERSINNYKNRCLHHHVFDIELLVEIFNNLSLDILYIKNHYPVHIISILRNNK